ISPNNRMPAIVDHDGPDGRPISIFESGAILQYLGRKTGKFYPRDERARVEVDQWLFWQMANLGPKAGEANHFRHYAAARASPLLADRAHDARGGAGVTARRTLRLLQDHLVVSGNRRHRKLRLHEDDLVVAGLEIIEQVHRCLGRRMLEIVHQHDAFAMLLQFFHHRLPDLLGLAHFEVEGIHVGREDRDVALAEIVDELLRLPQRREAEIGRSWSANRPVHGTDAHLYLVFGVVLPGWALPVDIAPPFVFRQILVAPRGGADGVPASGDLLENAGLVGGVQADREEDRLGAVRGERG